MRVANASSEAFLETFRGTEKPVNSRVGIIDPVLDLCEAADDSGDHFQRAGRSVDCVEQPREP